MSYIESELEALEREQESIDLKAGALEKKLRSVMGGIIDSKCLMKKKKSKIPLIEFLSIP